MKKTLLILGLIYLLGQPNPLPAAEKKPAVEPAGISTEDQKVIEVLEILKLMEIMQDYDLVKDLEILIEEETHEKES